ncbi:MAG: UDP-N-acetylmuramoyl-L-alanine--D-glutamate ligase, partial [Oscillospiraceae bacterium]
MQFSAKTFFPAMQGRTIDVIGLGVSNTELVFRLVQAGAQVTLHDRRQELLPELLDRLSAAGVRLCLGQNYLDSLAGE